MLYVYNFKWEGGIQASVILLWKYPEVPIDLKAIDLYVKVEEGNLSFSVFIKKKKNCHLT